MHLICVKHKRRSMVLPSGRVLHRSGETCDTKMLMSGMNVFTPGDIKARPGWSTNG